MNKPIQSDLKEGLLWKNPNQKGISGEFLKDNGDATKIANTLGEQIAKSLFGYGMASDVTAKLIANSIVEQIEIFLNEYANLVAEDAVKYYFKSILKEYGVDEKDIFVDYDHVRHAKLSNVARKFEYRLDEITDPGRLLKKIDELTKVELNNPVFSDNKENLIPLKEIKLAIEAYFNKIKEPKVDIKFTSPGISIKE